MYVQRHEHVEYKSPWMDLLEAAAKDTKIGAVLRIRLGVDNPGAQGAVANHQLGAVGSQDLMC